MTSANFVFENDFPRISCNENEGTFHVNKHCTVSPKLLSSVIAVLT